MFDAMSGNSMLRSVALCAAVACATLYGASAGAAPEDPAMLTCRSAFITQLTQGGFVADGVRVTFLNRGYVATEAQYLAGGHSYDLLARDAKNGKPMAMVTCNVDATGSVLAMLDRNLRPGPALAARF